MALPPTICFIVAGGAFLARRLPPSGLRPALRGALLSVVAGALFFLETFSVPGKPWWGFGDVAASILSQPQLESSVLLVSSGPTGEGAFVSEIASRERRPGHIVLRGSKVLATSRWDGGSYRSHFETTDSLWDFLRETPVGVIVVDRRVPRSHRTPDLDLLWETLQENSEHWTLLASYPAVRNGVELADSVYVYKQNGHETRPVQRIRIDLTEMLGRHVEGAGSSGKLEPGTP